MGVDPRYLSGRVPEFEVFQGGGFKTYFVFTPSPGEMIQFDDHIFQLGWFNHQLETDWSSLILVCLVGIVGDVFVDSTMELVHLEPPFGEYVFFWFSFLSSRGLSRLEVPRKISRKSLYLEVPWTMFFSVKTGVMYYKQDILEFGRWKVNKSAWNKQLFWVNRSSVKFPLQHVVFWFFSCNQISSAETLSTGRMNASSWCLCVTSATSCPTATTSTFWLATKKQLVVSNNFLPSPLPGEDSHFDYILYFSNGWKPPTRKKIRRSKQDKQKGYSQWPFRVFLLVTPQFAWLSQVTWKKLEESCFLFQKLVIMVFFRRRETPKKYIWSVDSSEGGGRFRLRFQQHGPGKPVTKWSFKNPL